MLLTLLIFVVLLAFIFLGFPIFMALLITGLIFLITVVIHKIHLKHCL